MNTTTLSSPLPVGAAAATLLLLLLLLEQISYLRKKRFLPGPALVTPLVGSVLGMILNPTAYWRRLAARASTSGAGLSADYLLGRFIVFLHDVDLSHKVFSNVRPDGFMVIGHPFGKRLFGEHNMIYMSGQYHRDLRARLAPNFTPRALSTYLLLQQRIICRHISRWLRLSSDGAVHIPLRKLCRDMNLETSQTVFAGPYLSPETRKRFNHDYNLFNVGLMALPFDLPGFAFRRARLAVGRLAATLADCASQSRARMGSRLSQPGCLVDYWMQGILQETAAAGEAIPESADVEIGGHLFDFLFAAQDASTSSLLWAVALLESHPDVLRRVREEVARYWTPASGEPVTTESLRAMKYTERVVREVLRYRPPATLVPHIALEDFPLTEQYTVPKGTIVFPSTLEASSQGFESPERFDPERFSDERREECVYKKCFLVFGAGPHQCVGQRYAMNHLHLFVVLFVSLVNFKRHRVDGAEEDEIRYMPTIVPKDDCSVYLSQRSDRFPEF